MSISNFFNDNLETADPEIFATIENELDRQRTEIELIASENIVSRAVMEAIGSVFTNKYAEGYPGRRYYGGCQFADVAESLAIERACKLFNCSFANVQPHSGAQANAAVFLALLNPGDKFMGLSLNAGGHLTHGSPVNISGKWFDPVSYSVREQDDLLDFDQIEDLAKKHRPKLIIAGGSAYSRPWYFSRFREIADRVGALLMVDMAHVAGLVAAGLHENPLEVADVVTTTTHKTLRGPRGGMILTNNDDLKKKLNSAVFPGSQGGPLLHSIAGKAVAFKEALTPEFRQYSQQVIDNARSLADRLTEHGFRIVSGGTDNHLLLLDLSPKKLTGQQSEKTLERAHITTNKNSIPFDTQKPMVTSGIRLGTPACTTRGMKQDDFKTVADLINRTLEAQEPGSLEISDAVTRTESEVKGEVLTLLKRFPIYS